jgi:hypothetical protein
VQGCRVNDDDDDDLYALLPCGLHESAIILTLTVMHEYKARSFSLCNFLKFFSFISQVSTV